MKDIICLVTGHLFGTEKNSFTYVTARRMRLRIRTIMPSLSGATKIKKKKNMNELSDMPTLIYFWAMSCSQCEQSIEKLNIIGNIFSDRLNIQAIHMPREELDFSSELVRRKVKELGINYPIHLDNELIISDRFGNKIVPAYYLFDQQQKLRFYHAGALATKSLQGKIERII